MTMKHPISLKDRPYLPPEQNNRYRNHKLKLLQIRKHIRLLHVVLYCSQFVEQRLVNLARDFRSGKNK